jgi:cyanophycinase-like exopeptidase
LLDGDVSTPRLLIILGSGETSPTMVTPHQQVFAQLSTGITGSDRSPVEAVAIDSPYGFQENADELTVRIHDYFADSVGRTVDAVRFRSVDDAAADPAAHAEQMARLRAARWIFAGPGSPSYALRTWADSAVPSALHDRLAPEGGGGAVVFASAAALTLGAVTVPVYEIYKVGEEPTWLTGLDVVGRATGLRAAVIPHFDNTEGGTHDTRYCYLGERRLKHLETQLPEGVFVLGVDEHTGLIIDLASGDARVVGRGGVTVRAGDRCTVRPSGSTMTLDDIASWAETSLVTPTAMDARTPANATTVAAVNALLDEGRVGDGVRALLEVISRGDADAPSVAALVARVGELAASPTLDTSSVLAPFVDLLLQLRADARAGGRYDESDAIRDRLTALGVEVRDTATGVEWQLGGAAT